VNTQQPLGEYHSLSPVSNNRSKRPPDITHSAQPAPSSNLLSRVGCRSIVAKSSGNYLHNQCT